MRCPYMTPIIASISQNIDGLAYHCLFLFVKNIGAAIVALNSKNDILNTLECSNKVWMHKN